MFSFDDKLRYEKSKLVEKFVGLKDCCLSDSEGKESEERDYEIF